MSWINTLCADSRNALHTNDAVVGCWFGCSSAYFRTVSTLLLGAASHLHLLPGHPHPLTYPKDQKNFAQSVYPLICRHLEATEFVLERTLLTVWWAQGAMATLAGARGTEVVLHVIVSKPPSGGDLKRHETRFLRSRVVDVTLPLPLPQELQPSFEPRYPSLEDFRRALNPSGSRQDD